MHVIMPNFTAIGQAVYENSITNVFYTLHYFGTPGGPSGPKLPVWVVMYNKATSIKLPNFVPVRQSVYARYLLLKFVDFIDGLTDRQTNKKTNSKRQSSHYNVVTKNTGAQQ